MRRASFSLLFLVALLVVSYIPGFGAQSAHAHQVRHFTATCYGDGFPYPCDGIDPPPISTCNGVQTQVASATIFGEVGAIDGTLFLYESNKNGCSSFWGAVNVKNYCITVTAIGMWETGADGSNVGGLDGMPVVKCPGQWESTNMVGWHTTIPSACFHVALSYKDQNGVQQGIVNVPNSPYYCPT